jgi:hypothetical protein
MVELHLHFPYAFMARCLVKHRDKCTCFYIQQPLGFKVDGEDSIARGARWSCYEAAVFW